MTVYAHWCRTRMQQISFGNADSCEACGAVSPRVVSAQCDEDVIPAWVVSFAAAPYVNGERDPLGVDQHAPGAKLDDGKTRVWLCVAGFSRALGEVAKVTTFGAVKYTPNGWTKVPDGADRYMEAFGRHALALGSGERVDDQSKCLHKAQMIWNLLASLELELRGQSCIA